ncbi:MAG: glycosyltransferase [Marinoscillum sp.]|uniref:glycosyltransferase n=1 Tax=Marinoscillum sp. TaxID=2024838 RepID=UPI0032F761B5
MNITILWLLSLPIKPYHVLEYFFYTFSILHLYLIIQTVKPLLRKRTSKVTATSPDFTVLVCAHNEEENLRTLVPLLLAQEYPCFEIIIVLDRCTDGSNTLMSSLGDDRMRVIEITRVPEAYNPKKYAIKSGVEMAGHEWLLLTDADCHPVSNQWIASFARCAAEKTEVILGVSPYTDEAGLISQLTSYETLHTAIHYTSAACQGKAYMGVGRNIAYRKDTFEKVDGFHPFEAVVGGDDDLLVQKMSTSDNTVVNFNSDSLTYSLPERKWEGYLKQKTRHLSVGKHYQPAVKMAHFIRAFAHGVLWLCFLYLLFSFQYPTRIIVLFGLLILVKGVFFRKIANNLGMPFHGIWFPLMDLIYAVFLPLLGVRAMFVKNIRWTK